MATMLFKVFALTLKTVAKPLASRFEKFILGHPVAREKIVNFAQRMHKLEVSINRGAEGKAGRAFVGEMSDEKALQLASRIVSEGFVYAVGIGVVVLEIDRKRREDLVKKAKDEQRAAEVRSLHEQHLRAEKDLKEQSGQLAVVLQSMDDRLRRLELAYQLLEDSPAAAGGYDGGS
ncbi:hypothetical protein N2152v2_000048 [Parachlorella kessleri]